MSVNSLHVLANLVRSGIWSKTCDLANYKNVVLDVESIVTSLFRLCISDHIRKLQNIARNSNQTLDLHAATLINYLEFSRYVKQLLNYLANLKITPILVYSGKEMEAPLFGMLAAGFERNVDKVRERVSTVSRRSIGSRTAQELASQVPCPSLALMIFKSIVNLRCKTGEPIRAYQSFYSPYPLMAKLARDYKCPVVTNNAEFIIMDVRAGFIIFDEFWNQNVSSRDHSFRAKTRSISSVSSSSSAPKTPKISESARGKTVCRFHSNIQFLHQHPGLNAPLAINLFPLTDIEMIKNYSKSLKRLGINYDEYKREDFTPSCQDKTGGNSYKIYHLAANRLELALRFLSTKTVAMLGNFVRGEATRTNSSLDDDYRQLLNYHAVAFSFKERLRFVLKFVHDPAQLNYIEWCLVNRECTPDHLMNIICCSLGRLASVSYNKQMQYEDLATRRSAYSLLNRQKAMLMSIFTANESHKSESSISLTKKQPDLMTRYASASLTIVDRLESKVVEHVIDTTHEDSRLETLRDKLKLCKLARNQVDKKERIQFINLVFNTTDLLCLPPKLDSFVSRQLGKDEHCIRNELAIVLSLFKFCCESCKDDSYFKTTYSSLVPHFESAILNHYLYLDQTLSKRKYSKPMLALTNAIITADSENVANCTSSVAKDAKNKAASKGSSGGGMSRGQANSSSKYIGHLIHLLNGSLEAFCELNAFLAYPLPKLNLHLHYNPLLLFNLTLLSLDHVNNKALLKP